MLREEILQDFMEGYYSRTYELHDKFCMVSREFSVSVKIHVRHFDIPEIISKYSWTKVFYMDDVIVDAVSNISAVIRVKENDKEFEDYVQIFVYRPTDDGEVYGMVRLNENVVFRITRRELKYLVVPILNSNLRDFVEVLDNYMHFPVWSEDIVVLWEKGCEEWIQDQQDIVCKELLRNDELEVIAIIEGVHGGDTRYYIVNIQKYRDELEAVVWIADKRARTIKAKLNT